MNGRPGRRAFTLFEIILALAVLGLAMGVISQVVWSGMENARTTQDLVQAELLAENLMAEMLAGIRPLESAGETPFDEESGLEDPTEWVYSIDVAPLATAGLSEASVSVRQNTDKAGAVRFSLVRWVLVPEESSEETSEE